MPGGAGAAERATAGVYFPCGEKEAASLVSPIKTRRECASKASLRAKDRHRMAKTACGLGERRSSARVEPGPEGRAKE